MKSDDAAVALEIAGRIALNFPLLQSFTLAEASSFLKADQSLFGNRRSGPAGWIEIGNKEWRVELSRLTESLGYFSD